MKNILFLGYSREQTYLIGAIESRGYEVFHTSGPLANVEQRDWAVVVSYGYRYILSAQEITNLGVPIINLHISYLPYNRGAHPNFWAFCDDTPHGVTIHELDSGIDTGAVIFQKRVVFDRQEDTFSKTYKRLVMEIETLFLENVDILLSGQWVAVPQQGVGTFHKVSDLPQGVDWNANIKEYFS